MGKALEPPAEAGGHIRKRLFSGLGWDLLQLRFSKIGGEEGDVLTNRLALQVCTPSLYDGLDDVALSDPISREQAAQMMYNMLDNATIWAYPHNSEVLGETTYQYEYKNDENGRPLTFFEVHFADWEREDIF